MNAITVPYGELTVKRSTVEKAPISWRLRNAMRWSYIWGWITTRAAILFSKITGIPTIISELRVRLSHEGKTIDYGVVGRRVVTDTGVGFIVDAWQNSVELETMKYHGCGIGDTAENKTDSALVSECTTKLNPDSTRATGAPGEGGTANVMSTEGALTFDDSATVTEHGLFSQAATGGGVMFDRTVFVDIGASSSDVLTFTYLLTFTSGG